MKISRLILLLMVVGALFVPAVSAEELIDSASETNTLIWAGPSPDYQYRPNSIRVYDIQDWKGLHFVYIKSSLVYSYGDDRILIQEFPYYAEPVTLKIGTNTIGHGTAYYNGLFTSDGNPTHLQMWVEIDEFDTMTYTGSQTIIVVPDTGTLFNGIRIAQSTTSNVPTSNQNIGFWNSQSQRFIIGDMIVRTNYYWQNDITISDNSVALTRVIDGSAYKSNFVVTYNTQTVTDNSLNNIEVPYYGSGTWNVTNPYGRVFTGALEESTPTDPTNAVTVYVQNSQTGALIADTDLSVLLYGSSIWYNSTLEWGWDSIELPAGNYEFYAEKSGFTQSAPGRLTVDGIDDNIVILLYPEGETPPAGNLTLQFWVHDGNNYGIPEAKVSVIGHIGEGASYSSGIITTNTQGYVELTAPGNTSYTAYASKYGYISGENEFTVTTYSPVHIGIQLTPGQVPTPTPYVPTPTPTIPTPEETPGPGFIDQSANNFATFLGVSYEGGRAALGMLIATTIGFTTARKLKGGAPEFGIGFIAGAALMVLITLLPAWIFIVMVIIVGGILGYKYMSGGS